MAATQPTSIVAGGTTAGDERLLAFGATRDPSLRDEIVADYLPLARYIANRYRDRGEPFDDLLQVACLGLVKAVERFDPRRGARFASFAIPTMLGELTRHFRDRAWALHAPRGAKDLYVTVSAAVGQLTAVLGRSPTVAEIAASVGAREDEVVAANEVGHAFRTTSLTGVDTSIEASEDVGWLREAVAVDEEDEHTADNRDELRRLLDVLSPRDRAVVYLRFFEDLTQSEIAVRIGMSQMHVSRTLSRSLERMRTAARA